MTAKLDFKLLQGGRQILRGVISVVKMNLHFPIAVPAELGEVVEELRAVLLGGKEECMLRRPAIDIVELVGKFRVVLAPMASAGPGGFLRWVGPEWFVVIHKAEEHMRRRNEIAPLARGEIAGEPDLGILEQGLSTLNFRLWT